MAETEGYSPPSNVEAERSVLGGILLDEEIALEAFSKLTSKDFFESRHQRIFQVCRDLDSRNCRIDLVTLTDELTDRKMLDQCGGSDYLISLTDDIPILSNVIEHLNIVRNKSLLRRLLSACQDGIRMVLEGGGEAREIIDLAEKKIFEVSVDRSVTDFVPLAELVGKGVTELEKLRDSTSMVTGLSTGFDELDELTTGLHESELVIIAARPAVGKTSLALNMAEHMASATDRSVGFFSLEMSSEQLVRRFLCANSGVGIRALADDTLPEKHRREVQHAADRLSRLKIFIDDTASIGPIQLRAKARRLARRTDLAAVFVDYLQLMRVEGRAENRQQEISQISGSLKALAKELRVPVIALSQLSRRAANREGPPRLSDLRESGAIEQDADLVLFLHDPTLEAGPDEMEPLEDSLFREILLRIGKQRNGPRGNIRLVFDTAISRFFSQAAEEVGP